MYKTKGARAAAFDSGQVPFPAMLLYAQKYFVYDKTNTSRTAAFTLFQMT